MNREQIAARRTSIAARLVAIAALLSSESRTITAEEQAESDTLDAEDKGLESTDRFLARMEVRNTTQLQEVQQRVSGTAAVLAREPAAPAILTKTTQAMRNGDKFKGQSWVMGIRAKVNVTRLLKDGVQVAAADYAARQYPHRPDIAQLLAAEAKGFRAANEIAGAGTQSGDWGHELKELDSQFTGDFIEFLYSKTVFDQLGLRDIPGNVVIKGQDGAATGYFVGEHKAIPMSSQDYSDVTLGKLKAAALCTVSNELLDNSSPAAYQLLLEAIVEAIAQKVDGLFWSNTAASSGVAPAGILNGVSGTASAGGTLADLYADISALLSAFITAKNTTGLKFVSNKIVATQIGLLLSELTGLPVFPDITEDGGTLHKKPYLTGDNVTAEELILLKPSDIYKIGDSGVKVSVSTDATLEMASDPTGAGDATPVAQSKQMVSMFQNEMTALKVVRDINWAKRRSSAVQLITNADYDGTHNTTD